MREKVSRYMEKNGMLKAGQRVVVGCGIYCEERSRYLLSLNPVVVSSLFIILLPQG